MFIFRPVSRTVYANKVYAFDGGDGVSGRVRVQEFNGLTLSTVAQNISQSIILACSTYIGSVNYIFGGYGKSNIGDTAGVLTAIRRFSSGSYTTAAATLTTGVTQSSAGAITSTSTAYVFGGKDSSNNYLSTTWSYDGTTLVTTGVTTGTFIERTSSSHPGGNIYLFGGINSIGNRTNSINVFNGTSMTNSSQNLTTARNAAVAGYLESYSSTYIFGGASGVLLTDIKKFTGSAISTESSTLDYNVSQGTASGAGNMIHLFNAGTGGVSYRSLVSSYNGTAYFSAVATLANDGGGEVYSSSQSYISGTAVV